jgi:hypothetical protein
MWTLSIVVGLIGVIALLSYYAMNLNVQHWQIKTLFVFATMAFLIINTNVSMLLIQQFSTNPDLLRLVVVTQNVLQWFLYILTAYFMLMQTIAIFEMFKQKKDDKKNYISETP